MLAERLHPEVFGPRHATDAVAAQAPGPVPARRYLAAPAGDPVCLPRSAWAWSLPVAIGSFPSRADEIERGRGSGSSELCSAAVARESSSL